MSKNEPPIVYESWDYAYAVVLGALTVITALRINPAAGLGYLLALIMVQRVASWRTTCDRAIDTAQLLLEREQGIRKALELGVVPMREASP